jgi:hypothetical protein
VRWASRVTLPSRSLTWRTRWTGSCWTWGRSRCRRRRSCRGNSGWRSTLPQNLKLNENIIVVLIQSRPLIVIMVNLINKIKDFQRPFGYFYQIWPCRKILH